jgi:hypothetical protein
MKWNIEYTDEFGRYWDTLSIEEQESLAFSIKLLEAYGFVLGMPHSSAIYGSKHRHMRELRTQHKGRPFRTLYAFDPRRTAILLVCGDKTGKDRWYEENILLADKLYDEYLLELKKEGLVHG